MAHELVLDKTFNSISIQIILLDKHDLFYI